ncbi:MAG: type II toxin-antitoxin system PemK/MazF family toxin [Bacteroidetes bacterium]|nr:type II toxin-antitoxin system PemK/MazF family toxin [Bacteroidota bacterium]MBU1371495.1 type II toxin-antitoxin system PemK/MazF family toxin [Bacteroidota bacterium]MBU1485725.1 type II toxin-antitoxin system PemK/MazF family toxin [Bacteroidota bacterium]MBU1759401.1 type II toxin-antitoxin system PemK/MazF family toxin [Bacteroidota bacterium]MBU2047221.1 type II toxin-antitoxin system PemK/MazF family toxin [Bacteroidota bacterium]
MMIRQFDIWLCDLNPAGGTVPSKIRPVLIVQTNHLNKVAHPSTAILPFTSVIFDKAKILRINLLPDSENGLEKDSAILIDQIRAIDNKKLIKKLGIISSPQVQKNIKDAIKLLLDL